MVSREADVSRRAERAAEPGGKVENGQAGNIDPGMEASQGAAVAGERKAVRNDRSGRGEKRKAAACRSVLIRGLERTVFGEQSGEAFSAP